MIRVCYVFSAFTINCLWESVSSELHFAVVWVVSAMPYKLKTLLSERAHIYPFAQNRCFWTVEQFRQMLWRLIVLPLWRRYRNAISHLIIYSSDAWPLFLFLLLIAWSVFGYVSILRQRWSPVPVSWHKKQNGWILSKLT